MNKDWKKGGKSGNPAGRPKGAKGIWSVKDLSRALIKAKKDNKGVSFLDNICSRAYTNDRIAVAILKKMLPDLKQIDAVVDTDGIGFAILTPAQAAAAMDAATVGGKPKKK